MILFRITAVAAVTAVAVAYIQTQRLNTTQDRLDLAERRAAGLSRSVSALNDYVADRDEEIERWRETVERLEQHEGIDDPLNDYERSVFDSVRQ